MNFQSLKAVGGTLLTVIGTINFATSDLMLITAMVFITNLVVGISLLVHSILCDEKKITKEKGD